MIAAAPLLGNAFGIVASGLANAQYPNRPDALAMTFGMLEIVFGFQGLFGLLKTLEWKGLLGIGVLLL
ncbi:hypothetical protein, partial [Vibrio cholerae]|uniref:hypothetical protein n=1 Tax=Vibrio cholerae TaxID=666 RepID=UPI001F488885